jgi:hypothetical protein
MNKRALLTVAAVSSLMVLGTYAQSPSLADMNKRLRDEENEQLEGHVDLARDHRRARSPSHGLARIARGAGLGRGDDEIVGPRERQAGAVDVQPPGLAEL